MEKRKICPTFYIFSPARVNISDFHVNRFPGNDIPVKSNLPTY